VVGEKEHEANTFACNKLIPPAAMQRFLKKGKPTLSDIERFSDEINIAPGIVVGRLQHEGVLQHNTGNRLKVFYRWA
jgi:Zn-dependent peptidase ImmA (M78 family)